MSQRLLTNDVFRHPLSILCIITQLAACSGSDNGSTATGLLVDAGPDQTIVLADAVDLDATITENGLSPQGITGYRWSRVSGPGSVDFARPDAEDTSASFSKIGSYVLGLTVNTGSDSASDTVDITVNLKAAGGSGLASRPVNPTECIAPATPPVATRIRLENPFPNLPRLTSPLAMVMAPGDRSYWYVLQQTGQVIRFVNSFG